MSTPGQRPDAEKDPWAEFTDFERDYFKQTRAEIDSDKRERDLFLNFAILIVGGGAAIAVGQADLLAMSATERAALRDQLAHPAMFAVIWPGLSIITALIWMRREKLVQIGIRWSVLHRMLSERLGDTMSDTLEAKMLMRFGSPMKAVKKEVVLILAVSTPIYALLVMQMWISLKDLPHNGVVFALSFVTLVSHALWAWWWFQKPIPEVPVSQSSPTTDGPPSAPVPCMSG